MKPFASLIVLFLLFPCLLIGQMSDKVEQLMTTFHLKEAETHALSLSSPYSDFYLSNIAIYRYAATQDEADMNAFLKRWDKTIAAIQKMPENQSHKKVLLAEMYGKRAIFEFIKQDYVSAAWHLKDAYAYIQSNLKQFPDEPSNQKIAGVFNVLLAHVPKDYQWFMNMLGIKGYFNTGYAQLQKAAANDESLLRSEANFVLYFTDRNLLGKNESGLKRLLNEQQKSGKGIVTDLFIATAHFSLFQNEKAYAILLQGKKYEQDANVQYVPFWNYLLGKSYYFKEDYVNARVAFRQFITKTKGDLFLTDANYRIGVSYLLSGDDANARTNFSVVSRCKPSNFDEDKYAMQMSKKYLQAFPSATEKQLYRARNLYDGGYFTQSLNLLNGLKQKISSLNLENRVELHYRIARVYHTSKAVADAKTAYAACTSEPNASQCLYMQAYSNYYLGEIYRAEGNKEAAKKHYQKALSYDKYNYQNGLEAKAKAALGRL